jgi:hypothetical protein
MGQGESTCTGGPTSNPMPISSFVAATTTWNVRCVAVEGASAAMVLLVLVLLLELEEVEEIDDEENVELRRGGLLLLLLLRVEYRGTEESGVTRGCASGAESVRRKSATAWRPRLADEIVAGAH